MTKQEQVDRNLALEAVRVTESAAIAASRYMGCGDEKLADTAAMEAMEAALNRLYLDGTIQIGEGMPGDDTALCQGDHIGTGDGPKVDVALVPVEGKSIVARGGTNALSVISIAESGGFLSVPDIYMEKIAIGPGLPEGIVDLDNDPATNIKAVADARGLPVEELVVCMLDRPRHAKMVAQIREIGARIRLILDGDVSGVISTAWPSTDVDMYMGIGGAQQGVLAAAAMRGAGGQMQGRLIVRNKDDHKAIRDIGIEDPDRKYNVSEMASGDVTFAATGITYGPLLEGVSRDHRGVCTKSMVLRSKTGTLRFIEGHHKLPPNNGTT